MAKKLKIVSVYVDDACDCSDAVITFADTGMDDRQGERAYSAIMGEERIKATSEDGKLWIIPYHAINRVLVQEIDCEDEPAEDAFCKEAE